MFHNIPNHKFSSSSFTRYINIKQYDGPEYTFLIFAKDFELTNPDFQLIKERLYLFFKEIKHQWEHSLIDSDKLLRLERMLKLAKPMLLDNEKFREYELGQSSLNETSRSYYDLKQLVEHMIDLLPYKIETLSKPFDELEMKGSRREIIEECKELEEKVVSIESEKELELKNLELRIHEKEASNKKHTEELREKNELLEQLLATTTSTSSSSSSKSTTKAKTYSKTCHEESNSNLNVSTSGKTRAQRCIRNFSNEIDQVISLHKNARGVRVQVKVKNSDLTLTIDGADVSRIPNWKVTFQNYLSGQSELDRNRLIKFSEVRSLILSASIPD